MHAVRKYVRNVVPEVCNIIDKSSCLWHTFSILIGMVGADSAWMARIGSRRFRELAEKRTNKALEAVRLVGNLSNRQTYAYEDAEVRKIVKALRDAVADIEARFGTSSSRGGGEFNYSAEIDREPRQADYAMTINIDFTVARQIEQCPKTMMLRELVMNAVHDAADAPANRRIVEIKGSRYQNAGVRASSRSGILAPACEHRTRPHLRSCRFSWKGHGTRGQLRHGREGGITALEHARDALPLLPERHRS